MPKIGIIGGTGVSALIQPKQEINIYTPYGATSDLILIGDIGGVEVVFLHRHGKNHTLPPHKINFKANIYAMKQLGVERIIATAACGSLRKDYKPGDIVILDQFIDFGKNVQTFYNEGRFYHISLAEPFCPELRENIIHVLTSINIPFHKKGTYLRIEGPQLSTRASSLMYSKFADVIGMTVVPEAILSRELEICFACVASITDYDACICKQASFEEIKSQMKQNMEKIKLILEKVVKNIPTKRNCVCKHALRHAG